MNTLSKRMKDLVNRVLGRWGYRLVNTRLQPWQPTLAAGLRRLTGRGLNIAALIDVGAADGGWARAFVAAVPKCSNLLLIEAQSVHRPALARFQTDFPQFQGLEHFDQLSRLVDFPILLRSETYPGTVCTAALVGPAECGRRCPGS